MIAHIAGVRVDELPAPVLAGGAGTGLPVRPSGQPRMR
jgi:hypothetical protein